MSVARTCARRRKQIIMDPRYRRPMVQVSRRLQGRSKLMALRDLTAKRAVAN